MCLRVSGYLHSYVLYSAVVDCSHHVCAFQW